MSSSMKDLAKIEQLRSLKSARALAELTAEETILRDQIDTLRGHRSRMRGTDPDLLPMRTIGADVLWHGWLDRTQEEVTIDLAKLLARKEQALRRMARDIGRREAAEQASRDQASAKGKEAQKKKLDEMLSLAVIKAALGRS